MQARWREVTHHIHKHSTRIVMLKKKVKNEYKESTAVLAEIKSVSFFN